MKTLIFSLSFFFSIIDLILPQDTLIVHPYRHPEILSSDNNGFTYNNERIFLSHLFDGHIYEYNLITNRLEDRFWIRSEASNVSSAGAIIYDKYTDKIYAATSTSMVRTPKIYIFDADGKNTPEFETAIDTLGSYSFFSPVVDSRFVYWGCYHSQSGGLPRIIRFDKVSFDFDILTYSSSQNIVKCNYTNSLCLVDGKIYIATEVGLVLIYNTLLNKYDTEYIDLNNFNIKKIHHIASDGKGIWVLTNKATGPLLYIENPGSYLRKVYPIPEKYNINFSRLCSDVDEGYLYGIGYRIKFLGEGRFHHETLPNINYHNIRNIHGLVQVGSNKYIFAENVRKKDEDRSKKEFRIIKLPPLDTPNIVSINDIDNKQSGLTILTLGSNKKDKLYLSTYLTGHIYSVDLNFNHTPEMLLDNNNIRIMAQSDIIGSFQDESDRMYFGFYDGLVSSAKFMIYNPNNPARKKWIIKNLPIVNEKFLARITSCTFDESGNSYIGTGEKTISPTNPGAKIFFLENGILNNPKEEVINQEININWPTGISQSRPVRLLSILYHNYSLYCIGYSPLQSSIINSFFRIDLKNLHLDIQLNSNESFANMGGNFLISDENRLIVAFGKKLLIYDLTNFNINSPLMEITIGDNNNKIRDIEKHRSYYVCLDDRIIKIGKDYQSTIFHKIGKNDKFISIEILHDYLVAATQNGLLVRFYLVEN